MHAVPHTPHKKAATKSQGNHGMRVYLHSARIKHKTKSGTHTVHTSITST